MQNDKSDPLLSSATCHRVAGVCGNNASRVFLEVMKVVKNGKILTLKINISSIR